MLTRLIKRPKQGHGVCLKVGRLGLGMDHRSVRGGGVRFRKKQHYRKKVGWGRL